MNLTQLTDLVHSGNFQLPTAKDDSVLIRDNKYFPGVPLYKKEYNGTVTYVAVFGTEIPRLGINALVNISNEWYVIPVVADLTLLKEMRPIYSKCVLLTGFAPNHADALKLETILKSLSTPFGFLGDVSNRPNTPTKRFPVSYTVKLSKSQPFAPDLDASITLLSDIDWDN